MYPDRIDMDWLSYEKLREIVFSPVHISQKELAKTEFYLARVYAAKFKYADD